MMTFLAVACLFFAAIGLLAFIFSGKESEPRRGRTPKQVTLIDYSCDIIERALDNDTPESDRPSIAQVEAAKYVIEVHKKTLF